METTVIKKDELVLPDHLPQGWKKTMAAHMGVSTRTITRILDRGKDDPSYKILFEHVKQKYGIRKSTNTQES